MRPEDQIAHLFKRSDKHRGDGCGSLGEHMTTPATGSPKIIKAHCPQCGPERNAYVRGEHEVARTDSDDGTSSSDTGFVLECCGCERVFFRRDFWFSEWETIGEHPITGEPRMEGGVETTYWPAPVRRPSPDWLPELRATDETLWQVLSEMYEALNNDLRVLVAIAARTAFDRSSELLGVDAAISFEKKLTELVTLNKISGDEKQILETLIDAGSAAAHRGWRPDAQHLATMMEVVEAFLHRSFIVSDGISRLKTSVPPRPPKKRGP